VHEAETALRGRHTEPTRPEAGPFSGPKGLKFGPLGGAHANFGPARPE